MKFLLLTALLTLTGCAQLSGLVNQSQAALEQANHLKGMEAMEIVCNRLYTKTFQELYPTKESVEAWRTLCKDKEFTP